ncbi:MAG TPA: hypothetical protein VLH58_03765 [Candidatus Methylomirabilis sp.]|nr:hypothetical protein [Candidatus Methylomirabilis sp.]
MGRVRVALACTACCVFLLAWAIAGLHPRPIAAPLQEAAPAACPDPMAIVKAFYDANDASRFDRSLGFLTEDATLSTWAEGVNGYHARARHFAGKKEIRPVLGEPGLRRTPDRPDRPIYKETRVKISGNQVSLILEPDRLRPNGKPYNPFRVEVVLSNCKIKSLTVIDLVTWL